MTSVEVAHGGNETEGAEGRAPGGSEGGDGVEDSHGGSLRGIGWVRTGVEVLDNLGIARSIHFESLRRYLDSAQGEWNILPQILRGALG